MACSLQHASHAELKRQTTDALVAVIQPIRDDIARLLDDKRCASRGAVLVTVFTLMLPASHIHNVLSEVVVQRV